MCEVMKRGKEKKKRRKIKCKYIYLVTNISIRTQLGPEIPNHDAAIQGGGGELLHVRVEGRPSDPVLVPSE